MDAGVRQFLEQVAASLEKNLRAEINASELKQFAVLQHRCCFS
jgi:hypothetical protein